MKCENGPIWTESIWFYWVSIKGWLFFLWRVHGESEEHHHFNRMDATVLQLSDTNDEYHSAEDNFVHDIQAEHPASFLQVDAEPETYSAT